MEISLKNSQRSMFDETYSFIEEINAVNSLEENVDVDVDVELNRYDKKKIKQIKYNERVIDNTQEFRLFKRKNARPNSSINQKVFQFDSNEKKTSNLDYNLALLNTSMLSNVILNKCTKWTVSDKAKSSITLFVEPMCYWQIEGQSTEIYVAEIPNITLNKSFFLCGQKLKSYLVLYRGKYYLFEFEGGDVKEYYEVKHDRS